MSEQFVVRLVVADRVGLIAEVAGVLAGLGANVVEADSHSDAASGYFAARFRCEGADLDAVRPLLSAWARSSGARVWLDPVGGRCPIVVCGSRQTHCVADLLERCASGELPGEVVRVVSDHDTLESVARRYSVPFSHLAVGGQRSEQERRLGEVLEGSGAGLVVLARYMRVLPSWLVARWEGRMINIHHSSLPAFVGARPYERAFERGVKLVGATAHYVTDELDEGPIIAQSSVAVTHRDSVEDLKRRGADVERVVLAHAVRVHLEHRVVVVGGRTLVFE